MAIITCYLSAQSAQKYNPSRKQPNNNSANLLINPHFTVVFTNF